MFLEPEPFFGAGALFLGDNGSPARFAESLHYRIGREKGVAAAGPGISLFGVGGGDMPGKLLAGQFGVCTGVHEVGGAEVVVGGCHGWCGLWLRPALTFEFTVLQASCL